jgi:hypothetical protein
MNQADNIPQSERRKVMESDRLARRAGTYFSQASAGMDDERGGRFAALNKPTVTGSGGGWAPKQPPNSPWAKDHCPPEPPLGWSVDDQEPVGEPHEIERSLKQGRNK